jgi:hypothetical protein
MGARAESVHDHHRFAEPSRHKEIGDVFYFFCGPDTDTGYPDKV